MNSVEQTVQWIFLLGDDSAAQQVTHQDGHKCHCENRRRRHGVGGGKRQWAEQATLLGLHRKYGQERHRDPGNPLVGQQSGVRYWNEKLNPGIVTDVTHGVGDFVIDNTERVIDTVGRGIETVQDLGSRAGDFVGEAAEDVGELMEFVF